MTYPTSDIFADRRGRWGYFAPWDATQKRESVDAFLDTQEHVDLRSFRAWRVTTAGEFIPGETLPRPQDPDLDVGPPFSPQSTMIGPVPQTELEQKRTADISSPGSAEDVSTELWKTVSGGTGLQEVVKGVWDVTVTYAANDIVQYQGRFYKNTSGGNSLGNIPTNGTPWALFFLVGKIDARGGWSGLQVKANNAALNVTLESSMPGERVNISEMDFLSIIFPDYNSFTTSTSWVQLTSDVNGVFGTGHDSAQVLFSANASTMPHLKLPMGDFAATGFNAASVSGVRVHYQASSAPANNTVITMMAIRALKSTWAESWLDFDTRWNILYRPVTLNGNVYAGATGQNMEYIRGDGTRDDPIPESGSYTIFFYPGGQSTPVDGTSPSVNKIAILMREIKDSGAGTGSVIHAELTWNTASVQFASYREDTTGASGSAGAQSQHGNNAQTVSNTPLDPGRLYAFQVKLIGKTLSPKLIEVNRFADIVDNDVWIGAPVNEDLYTIRNGRVGFRADLLNRDAWIETFAVAPTDYATLRTPVFWTRSPVDGCQLSAVFSPDANLYTNILSEDAFRDQTKTLSGEGSFRTAKGLTTNQFIAEDFTEMYFDVSIWVPATVTPTNQPLIKLLTSGGAQHNFRVPDLQAAQWNTLHFDMGVFRSLVTGLPYTISITPGQTPVNTLGFFWVDQIKVGRRKVAWSVRAQPGGQFRRFRSNVNTPNGAVHFNPSERGTALQLQADALTPDAWIVSPPKIFPHYAELGLPVFDQVSVL